jgi:hypothetical protein
MPIHSLDDAAAVPSKPRARKSFDENLDEAKALIEQEPADVQSEHPDEGNRSVEQVEDDAEPSQGFEDDDATGE